MGKLSFVFWARLLAMTAGLYTVWGAIWGILFRKFFFDMVGGVLGPAGLIPPKSADPFVSLIVNVPVFQIINIINGLFTIMLDYPVPFLQTTSIYRSLVFRIAFYVYCSFFALMVYQTVDAGVFYLITAGVLTTAVNRGERIELPGQDKGARRGADAV